MKRNAFVSPAEDRILSPDLLGERWNVHPRVALERAKNLGLRPVKFNTRSQGFLLSDVVALEAQLVA
jgi:hypothetical protein